MTEQITSRTARAVTPPAEVVPLADEVLVPPPPKKGRWGVYFAIGWLGLLVGVALLANVLPIAHYSEVVGAPRQSPTLKDGIDHLLGTDTLGRSVLSRCVYGARVSLVVGATAGLVGFTIGCLVGLIGGYFGKATDAITTTLADAVLAFPPLIMLIALASVLKPSLSTLLIGLTILVIPTFVRLSRASVLAWRVREFVTAARSLGAGSQRILARDILPNVIPTLATYLPIVVAGMIVAEGSLSFLGLGIPPPTPSWGGMIADGKDAISTAPWMVFVPASFVFLTVFSLNQAGDHLRDRFDVTLRG